MAQFTAYRPPPQPLNPVWIIGPQYCFPYPVDLAIVRKVMTITDGNFDVKDSNGYIHFNLKGFLMTLHDRRVLSDAAGTPLVTLRGKFRSLHDRWQVFRGESTDLRDLILLLRNLQCFSARTSGDSFSFLRLVLPWPLLCLFLFAVNK
ncbi:hypothetical protein QYF36_015274 [Acer negundo]|nr:hypothetical protein QYF36_015274 [Acer negundo]